MVPGGGKTKKASEMGMEEALAVGRSLIVGGKEERDTWIVMLGWTISSQGLAQRRT